MKLVKCKGCNAPIGRRSLTISEMVRASYEDRTKLKQCTVESVAEQLCKECFEKKKGVGEKL